jgi:hypothetical protein
MENRVFVYGFAVGQRIYSLSRYAPVKSRDRHVILVCANMNFTAEQIIRLYGYRFKIEVTFLYRGRFSADEIRDITRNYAGEKLGDEDGVLVVDETGFLKQGKKSCGVKRQYGGTAGRIENCQIGVFLTYASAKGHAPIDRRLYIPEEWMEDRDRCKEASVPETVIFQKPTLPKQIIYHAYAPHGNLGLLQELFFPILRDHQEDGMYISLV